MGTDGGATAESGVTVVLLTGALADFEDDGVERIEQGGDARNGDGALLGELYGSLESIEAMFDSSLHGGIVLISGILPRPP
jgi:hypothetical protein